MCLCAVEQWISDELSELSRASAKIELSESKAGQDSV